MDLNKEELDVLRKLLERTYDENIDQWDDAQAARIQRMDPLAAALTQHQVWKHSKDVWACSCNNKPAYVSLNHALLTHVRPIVEKAATQKVRGILERSGMDLDAMLLTDKIFGEQEPKRTFGPSEHSMLRKRLMARQSQGAVGVRYCEHGNDINQPCSGCP